MEEKYVRKKWEDIRVGDFVHLSCNEVIPADIVLLHSSDDSGICHIDTSNLDGENNLKQRQIVWGLRTVRLNTFGRNLSRKLSGTTLQKAETIWHNFNVLQK